MDHSKLMVNILLELDVIVHLLGDVRLLAKNKLLELAQVDWWECNVAAALVIAEGTRLALQGLC
jgi:hypothetical protein